MSNPQIQELLRSGRHEEAEKYLREICASSGPDAESWFLLGALAGTRGDAVAAEGAFRAALLLKPDFLQAQFNLGIALRDLGRFEESVAELEAIVYEQPQHAEACNVLGYLYVRLERHDEAERWFRAALAVNAEFPDALTNLGNVLASRHHWEEAIGFHRRALAVAPNYASAAINLGGALLAVGRFEEAIAAFSQSVRANPGNPDAYVQLGTALNQSGKREEAEQAFREALKVFPGHAEAQYFLATLGAGNRPHTAPPEYVSKLFDGYAETFDEELVGKLQYRAPEVIFNAARSALTDRRDLDVLDLGCGTGLCGVLFKSVSRTLAGVDISPKMVAKARARAVYDELEIGELTDSLRKRGGGLDVVLAADVFIYVGDLAVVFEAAAKALRPAGLLAFSVEVTNEEEGESFVLRRTGRYAHSQAYVSQLAHRFGFASVSSEEFCLRLDNDQPIIGAVYVLQRTECGLVENESAKEMVVEDAAELRTPEATQVIAKKNYEAFLASIPADVHRREERLPADLRLMNAKPMVKLARIRKSVETLFTYADGHVACRKGCAYCCHQAIDISRLEAEYIQEKTGIRHAQLSKLSQRDPLSFSEKTPCSFLKQGVCSIYEYRPLICRIAVNLDSDPYWCEFENWHKPGGAVPKPTFRSIYNAFTELNETAGSIMADIRDFFPVVPD
jgi:predicted TPR repeat methyltransferase/Fe-S-cluster containining protein